MTSLPSTGRDGPTPKWPLPADVKLQAELKVAREREKVAKLATEDPDMTARQRAVADRSHAAAREKVLILAARARAARKRETDLWAELLEDAVVGTVGLKSFVPACGCCVPWTAAELAAILRDLADVAWFEAQPG